jgi:hypothetical protein
LKKETPCGKIWQRRILEIMAKTSQRLKTPFIIIAYDMKRIFSVDNDEETSILPIFTDAEAAEKYRRYFARKYKLKLQICVAGKAENGLNLVECAAMACKTLKYVVINPLPPSSKTEQPKLKPIQEIITVLMNQCRRQKAHSRQNLHKK